MIGYVPEVIAVDYMAIGKRIRDIRTYEKMTQEKLAELAGISTGFVGHIERGTRIPSVCTLYSICAALGVRMEYVIAGE